MKYFLFTACIGTLLLTACVQETYVRQISLQVDMRNQIDVDSVGIRGGQAPLDWNKTLLLTDKDMDGVYIGTLSIESPYKGFEYKFVKNDGVFELDGKDNRRTAFNEDGVTVIKAVYDKPLID